MRKGTVLVYASAALISVACTYSDARETRRGQSSLSEVETTDPVSPTTSLPFSTIERMEAKEMKSVTLKQVRDISLGTDSSDTPIDIREARIQGRRVYVLDAMGRRLRGYDRSGKALFTDGRWGTADQDFSDPVDLQIQEDTVFVLDLSHPHHLALYDLEGRYRGARRFSVPEGATSFAVGTSRFFVTTLVARPKYGNTYAMVIADREGRTLSRGCESDPRYRESERRDGFVRGYAFRQVSSFGASLYCSQPITPIVQIFDSLGTFIGLERRAPPFYRPPTDAKAEINRKAFQRFEASWTSHQRFIPMPHRFVSVYASFDSLKAHTRYRLFTCDSLAGRTTTRASCGVIESPGRPVGLLAPDTLLIAREPPAASAPKRLGLYVLN